MTTDEIWAAQRLEDWAVIKVDTGQIPPLPGGKPEAVAVGERLIVFNVESGLARALGGVDISGRRKLPEFGERIQFSPNLSAEAAGGPLLDLLGQTVGIIGGSLAPGARFNRRDMSLSPALWNNLGLRNAATPITAIANSGSSSPVTLKQLADSGVLTSPIFPMSAFVYGGATNVLPKTAEGMAPAHSGEFSRKDPEIWIYTIWQRKDKTSKGMLSSKVYDPQNRVRVEAAPKKIALEYSAPTRTAFKFSPHQFGLGTYRIDILWDGRPVWRTFISIID